MNRRDALTLAFMAMLGAGIVSQSGDGDGTARAGDPVFPYEQDDPDMAAAIEVAQQSLPRFLVAALPDERQTAPRFMVNVAFPKTGASDEFEHIWVRSFRGSIDAPIEGFLANVPVGLAGWHIGTKVRFDANSVTDWSNVSDADRLHGAFTLRVMHADGAMGDTPFEQVFERDPVPADWL